MSTGVVRVNAIWWQSQPAMRTTIRLRSRQRPNPYLLTQNSVPKESNGMKNLRLGLGFSENQLSDMTASRSPEYSKVVRRTRWA